MHKSVDQDLITVHEAAELLGISVQAAYQGLRKGIVRHVVVGGRKMVDRHRLVQRWKGLSDLEAQAELCNRYLDCSAWGPPPWSAEQWQTLALCIGLAQEIS